MPSKQSSRPKLQPRTLLTGLAFGESPRWRHDRLWISDWGAREIIAVDPAGKSEVMARAPSFPSCIDVDRGCFACMLGGVDRRTLFMVAREWRGSASMTDDARTGGVLTVEAPAPGAGWP